MCTCGMQTVVAGITEGPDAMDGALLATPGRAEGNLQSTRQGVWFNFFENVQEIDPDHA